MDHVVLLETQLVLSICRVVVEALAVLGLHTRAKLKNSNSLDWDSQYLHNEIGLQTFVFLFDFIERQK